MIPSSVNIENKALQPDIVLRYKKEKQALLIEVSEPVVIGAMGMIKKNFTESLQTIPGKITTN